MLIDFHAHSALSKCCQIDGKGGLIVARDHGMDGFILTNHYDRCYLINDDKLEFAKRYINEFYQVKKEADLLGMYVFFGVEVTMAKHNNVHILLYGVDPEFLFEYPDLYDYELKDLYELAHKNNAILVQAHPLRNNKNILQDMRYLDGIEANSHTFYEGPHLEEVTEIARQNNKLLTSGGDFHNDAPRAKCGVYIPKTLKNTKEIVNYILNTDKIKICVQLNRDKNSILDFIYNK